MGDFPTDLFLHSHHEAQIDQDLDRLGGDIAFVHAKYFSLGNHGICVWERLHDLQNYVCFTGR